ncbi:MAG: YfhO family protein [Candidatus Levybacteria bacterium]|nr:YfhO family protein [Candidatus Levybacteria bacterium]
MSRKELGIALFFFAAVIAVFFYKSIFFGQIPFPGDLLIAEYNPWKTYSYLGYSPGSYPNKAQYFDVLRQLYPWKTFTIDLIKSGQIPFWNPYNFSGAPLLANFQSAVFYPLGILYFFLPQVTAWSLLVVSQTFLAAFFTFLYARKIGISKIGSFFAGISFALSAFMNVWLEYNTIGQVILWLPLTLLSFEHLLLKREARWITIFIFSQAASLLAGHPQVFIYSFIFIVIYILNRVVVSKQSNKIALLLFFLLLLTLPIGIGAIQIISGLELIQQSARVSHDFDFLMHKILIQPWQFIMMFIPDFFGNPATRNYWPDDTYIGKVTYIGIIPLFFAFFSLKNLRNRLTRLFIVSIIIVLLLASFNPVTIILYKLNLPLISTSSPTLSVFLFCFCASLLAGIGVDLWRNEKASVKQLVRFLVPILALFIFLWLVVFFAPQIISATLTNHITIAYRNLLYATVIVVVGACLIIVGCLKSKLRFGVLIILLFIQTGDLFRSFDKFNPFVPSELVFPDASIVEFIKKQPGLFRVWGYGSANIEANFATQYAINAVDGYDPLYPKRYGEFIQASKNGKIEEKFTRYTRSDAFIAPGSGETELSSNMYRLKVLDLLGVKYVLDRQENASTEKTFSTERFKLIYERDGWKVFENLRVFPRAFLTSGYDIFSNNDEFEKTFFAKNFYSGDSVLLEDSISDFKLNAGSSKKYKQNLTIISYNPNKVIFQTDAQDNTLLFQSDVYYPGWKAYLDNNKTKIYRANYAFRAVAIPKGKHVVEIRYEPDWFASGIIISLGSFIFGTALVFYFFHKRKSLIA